MRKFLSPLIGLGLALATLLLTYLICGLAMDSFYLWGVIQLIITIGFFALAWFSSGLINRNIRRGAHDRLADTSFRNPKKAEYKTFLFSCYYACLFGLIINIVGYYAFGMGKIGVEDLSFLFLIK